MTGANNEYARIKANDDMALRALREGVLRVDAKRGQVFSSRWHRPLGSLDKEGYVKRRGSSMYGTTDHEQEDDSTMIVLRPKLQDPQELLDHTT